MRTENSQTTISAQSARSEHSTAMFSTSIDRLVDSPRAVGAVIGVVCLLSLFAGLGSTGLWGIRQKRAAACVADIFYDGRWLLPQMAGEPRLEKPPVPYWIIAGFARSVGHLDEWTFRLPGAIAGVIIIALTYSLARAAGGVRAGLLAALFLGTSMFFVVEVREPSTDLFLALFATCALASWWRGLAKPERRLEWWSITGLSVGLGLLTKGPVVLAVIAPPIVGVLVLQGEFRLPRSMAAWAAIMIAAVIAASWPLAVVASNREAWLTWILELDRKVARPDRAVQSPLFYLAQSPQYLFPWSVLSVAAVLDGVRWLRRRPPVIQLAFLWFVGDLILFSLPNARKTYYLLPAVPGLAVITGYFAARIDDLFRQMRVRFIGRAVVHLQFILLSAFGVGIGVASFMVPDVSLAMGLGTGCAWLALCVGLWRWVRHQTLAPAWVAAALVLALFEASVYEFILPKLDKCCSHRQLALRVLEFAAPDKPIVAIGQNDPALWFYLRNRPQLVGSQALAPATTPTLFLVPEDELEKFTQRIPHSEILFVDPDYGELRWRTAVAGVRLSDDPEANETTPWITGSVSLRKHTRAKSNAMRTPLAPLVRE